MALQDIENKIISDAESEAKRIISDAEAKAAEIKASAEKEAAENVEKAVKQAEYDANKELLQAVSLARLAGRDKQLTVKRSFISGVYAEALSQIGKASKKDYDTIIAKIFKSAGDIPSKASVILPKGKEKQTEEALKAVKNGSDLNFSKKTFDGVGGFILDDKDVTINGTFEYYLDGIKSDLESEVVKVLFGSK